MIHVADSNAVYYYHYDGLGSVVALSNSSGNSFQSYEYSIFGQVAAEDPNFTANPYLFTGRRFDYDTGLYYYRARDYNPYIGKFLQTDPIGYADGINWYRYCSNSPINLIDPTGLRDCNTTTWAKHFAPDYNDLADYNEPNSIYGRLNKRLQDAILKSKECSPTLKGAAKDLGLCLAFTWTVSKATAGNVYAAGGAFVGCTTAAGILSIAEMGACSAEIKCEEASAYESYNFSKCMEWGKESTKTCAEKYLKDQKDPLWVRIFSAG